MLFLKNVWQVKKNKKTPDQLYFFCIFDHLFIYSKQFILIRIAVYPEPIPTKLAAGELTPKWDKKNE